MSRFYNSDPMDLENYNLICPNSSSPSPILLAYCVSESRQEKNGGTVRGSTNQSLFH